MKVDESIAQVTDVKALACLEHSWLSGVWPWSSSRCLGCVHNAALSFCNVGFQGVSLYCTVQSSEVSLPSGLNEI